MADTRVTPAEPAADAPLSGSAALRRSGLAIATGTLVSRITGFARTVIIGVAIGLPIGDAYNTANTVPNILYDLLLGGVLSAVVVPLLVDAAARDDDDGEAFARQLLTLVVGVLAVVSVLGAIFAPAVISPYDGKLDPAQRHLAGTFARFFLPQLVFYGAGAVIGAILNVRDQFVAPMWAPVLNNLIVIATGGIFLAVVTRHPTPGNLHGTELAVLSIGTTAGIVVQTIVLVPALRRAGIGLRPHFGMRGLSLGRDGRFAGWMLGYVVVNQLGYVVITRLSNGVGDQSGSMHIGYSAYYYAYVLFSLPYAVVTVTVVTAVFPDMTRMGLAGDLVAVRHSLDRGLRYAAVMLVPATVGMIAFGPLITTVVLAHGKITLDQARVIGAVLGAFALGLVPFAAFQMQLRAWLALRDSRSPALINLAATAVNVVLDVLLYAVLPARDVVIGFAVSFSISYSVALAVSTGRLAWSLGVPRHRGLVLRTHVRLGLAALLALVPAYAVDRALATAIGHGVSAALLTLIVSAGLGLILFVVVARRLRVSELDGLLSLAAARFGGSA